MLDTTQRRRWSSWRALKFRATCRFHELICYWKLSLSGEKISEADLVRKAIEVRDEIKRRMDRQRDNDMNRRETWTSASPGKGRYFHFHHRCWDGKQITGRDRLSGGWASEACPECSHHEEWDRVRLEQPKLPDSDQKIQCLECQHPLIVHERRPGEPPRCWELGCRCTGFRTTFTRANH